MIKPLTLLLALALAGTAAAQTRHTAAFTVQVVNDGAVAHEAVPVVIALQKYGVDVHTALVTCGGSEVPCQIDDMDRDGRPDELCFMAQVGPRTTRSYAVTIADSGQPRSYTPRTYAEMMLPNKGNRKIYISELTVDRGSASAFNAVVPHGPAFENEYGAYRIYFDHRQTVDLYGKVNRQLELRQTHFYPSAQQLRAGSGDDVLWVGDSFGLGALRGWDGRHPTMIDSLARRTMRVLASGPVRAVVEVVNTGWQTASAGQPPVNMTTRYAVYAGRRDVEVNVSFDRPTAGYEFATGLVNVKGSEEYSDHHGLRACWGTDWPVAERDSVGHKRETVGLAISIPRRYVVRELPADRDNYPFVVSTAGGSRLHYWLNFASANETRGYHSAREWFAYLRQWQRQLDSPVRISGL
ncbi:MAG: DUF4861 domain-containing protein [Prevotella sp.]|nr:DUF4861 domain-containing protein [Prevotella sp.]MDD7606865.1 DUF4861 domain-containing protein [Prevotellaceae bacterium]MDY3248233.1 DUF4861 domain-containing protein [Prevotella sp.]